MTEKNQGKIISFEESIAGKPSLNATKEPPKMGRSHEECDECEFKEVEPQPCPGHVMGPSACRHFKPKAKTSLAAQKPSKLPYM